MSRTVPNVDTPDGFEYAARVAGGRWTTVPHGANRCRYQVGQKACGKPARAWLMRGMAGRWWAYCGDHLYGRWVERGEVMEWYLTPTPAPATQEPRS